MLYFEINIIRPASEYGNRTAVTAINAMDSGGVGTRGIYRLATVVFLFIPPYPTYISPKRLPLAKIGT
jgi:hypothetical protein